MTLQNPIIVVKPAAMKNAALDDCYKLFLCRAAAYCLQKSSGKHPVANIKISDSKHSLKEIDIDWDKISASKIPLLDATYADRKEVVEYAAYGVSLAYLSLIHGVYAVGRTASVGNGFDFYLNSHLTSTATPSGQLHRLEVSGIFSNPPKLFGRLRSKLQQAMIKKTPGTVRAVVVEFSEPRIGIRFRALK